MAGNGDVPDSQLVVVQGSIRLERSTAAAWDRMKGAAARSGVSLTVASPAGGYRSLDTQRDMHAHPERYNLNPQSAVKLAPVGQSTHGFGTRVDIGTSSGNDWTIPNARAFGFVREFGGNDPNHYEFIGPISPDGASNPKGSDVEYLVTEILTNGAQGLNHINSAGFIRVVSDPNDKLFLQSEVSAGRVISLISRQGQDAIMDNFRRENEAVVAQITAAVRAAR